jgi:phosphoribosylglycinamide formyltransferase-1
MTARVRTGVLISGRGSNLQSLIDACANPDFPAEIACVISNVAGAEGLARAGHMGIATHVVAHGGFKLREEFDMELDAALSRNAVSIVCLAGFMRVLSDVFVEKWRGRLINIHPSLLPGFKGLDVHGRVITSGARISGCTVHFVVPELDSGPIIAQAAVPVLADDTEESLSARTLAAEHRLYPHALKLLAEGRVKLDGERAVFTNISDAEGTLINPPLD